MNDQKKSQGFETLSIHAGCAPDPATGARVTPICQNTSYVFDSAEHAANLFALKETGYIYSRLTNPTVMALEQKIAALEGGAGATCTSSGHAAQMLALFALLNEGDEFIAARQLYGGSINQFKNAFPRACGWKCHFVDATEPEAFRRAITPKTRAIFIESLANPGGIVTDIRAIANVANEAGVPLIVDNTMATPYLCRPFEHGAHIVTYSTTKFLSGHGNSLGGALVDSGSFNWLGHADKYPALAQPEPGYHGLNFAETFGPMALTFHGHAVGLRDLGCCQQPMNAFLTLTGMETLALRMERHCRNAQAVAEFLETHSKVKWVQYAGLKESRFRSLAQTYLRDGMAGSVFTFGLKGGFEAGVQLVESVKLISHLANIGDTRSLVIHPASTTHAQLTDEQRESAGAGPDVIRISVGLETVADIIADLDQALSG
ncbi:MAG: O-acetylhomoserine aminocarboxypropyltransferase [Alphaproteobacteria bacterium]|nr:O-acetylhomoserine aminocarboxypropyltransferase [Alphaproteobacteria bacterium]